MRCGATHAILESAFEDFNEGVNAMASKYRAKRLRSVSFPSDLVRVAAGRVVVMGRRATSFLWPCCACLFRPCLIGFTRHTV